MALRKPTYLDMQYGEAAEMSPTADTIALAGVTINGTPAASTDAITVGYLNSRVKTVEITLPAVGVYEWSQSITDASVSATSNIVCSISGQAATGQDADNPEMDRPWVKAYPQNGSYTLYIQGSEGVIGGAYRCSIAIGS